MVIILMMIASMIVCNDDVRALPSTASIIKLPSTIDSFMGIIYNPYPQSRRHHLIELFSGDYEEVSSI